MVLPFKNSKLIIWLGFGFPVPRVRSPLLVPRFSIIFCLKTWKKNCLYNEVVTGGRRFVCLFVIFAFCLLKFTAFKAFFLRAIQPPSMDTIIYARTGLLACDGLVIDKATGCSKNRRYFLLLNNFTLSCYVKSVKKEQERIMAPILS